MLYLLSKVRYTEELTMRLSNETVGVVIASSFERAAQKIGLTIESTDRRRVSDILYAKLNRDYELDEIREIKTKTL